LVGQGVGHTGGRRVAKAGFLRGLTKHPDRVVDGLDAVGGVDDAARAAQRPPSASTPENGDCWRRSCPCTAAADWDAGFGLDRFVWRLDGARWMSPDDVERFGVTAAQLAALQSRYERLTTDLRAQ